jgi:diguanylate cyclase (GGDEF)-like protein/PAS domain S-box-containing protein
MTSRDRVPLQILLIEDNAGDVRLLRELLKPYGPNRYEIADRPSIQSALEHLLAARTDIILLDLGLPDAAGLDAVRRMRTARPRLPLVVLTGMDDEDIALAALQEGAQDYLIKAGLDGRILGRTLRFAIGRHAADKPSAGAADPRAEDTLNSIGDALVCADPAGNISFVNPAAEALTGWSWKDAAGRPMIEVLHVVDAGTRVSFHDTADGDGATLRTAQLHPNVVLVRRDGTEVPIEGSVAPLEGRDGRPAGKVLVFRDNSLARARVQQMAYSAQHDALTGLPNRVLLNDRINTAISIAPRHRKKVAVLFIDLDGFKQINDTIGHAIGDKLLQSVAARLLGCVRGSDTVSRLGGDEFVVLLSEVERPEDSAITARRMLEAVAETYSIDHHDLHVTASIGVAVCPDDGINAEALIKSADAAMYQAKENGRHGYQFYKPAMNLRAVERQEVEDGLRQALEREEFTLHFQPKVNLHTGEIAGAEALLRWEHPVRGPMLPSLFIPVAEACGLIQQIGSWVMHEACRQAQTWLDAGLRLPSIAVNVSAVEFAGAHFLDDVFEALNDTGLDPRALELELTESVLMKHAESTNSILQALNAGGVQMSIDDFGTGYSSLSYLRKFPIHTLKIDQSFVREITLAGNDASIVTTVLNMAQSLNLRVVAEGVETPEELAFLQLHRCDEAQGYYFSRPLPAPQFARVLRDGIVPTMAARQYVRPLERPPARHASAS